MSKFSESYKKYRSYKTYKRGEMRTSNHLICALDALDDVLTGNKLYDFYYRQIWSRIWRLFMKYPKDFYFFIKRVIQRGKYGISKQDSWAVNEYMLQVLYHGLKYFLFDEYGDEPIKWEERSCETHDKKLYDDAKAFIKSYEVRENSSVEDCYELDVACQKLFKEFIQNHIEKIWI